MEVLRAVPNVQGQPLIDCVFNDVDNQYGIQIRAVENLQNPLELRAFLEKNNGVGSWVVAVDLARVACAAQLVAAAVKVSNRIYSQGPFKTGSARGDVIYYASHHTNIIEASKILQLGPLTTDAAVVSVRADKRFLDDVHAMSHGTTTSVSQWFLDRDGDESVRDGGRLHALAKFYKLTPQELQVASVQDCVITKIATKEFIK